MAAKSILSKRNASITEKENYIINHAKCFKALAPVYQREIKDYLQNNPKLQSVFAAIASK